MSAGKGSKLRKGASLKLYWQNYDDIFKKEKLSDEDITTYNAHKDSMSHSEFEKFKNKKYGK